MYAKSIVMAEFSSLLETETGAFDCQNKLIKVVLVHEIQKALIQLLIGVGDNIFPELLCLKISAREQAHQVRQFPSMELMHEGHPQHIAVVWVVDIFIILGQHWIFEAYFDCWNSESWASWV